MWKVSRVDHSDTLWNVYCNNEFRGTACILDDAQFYGNIDIRDSEDPVKVVDHIEELIVSIVAEEDILMSY